MAMHIGSVPHWRAGNVTFCAAESLFAMVFMTKSNIAKCFCVGNVTLFLAMLLQSKALLCRIP
jgi:hypothetical protein